jgi:hypothetical protein
VHCAGQLEFEEFVLILKKLGGVSQEQSSWQELADDTWALDIGQGTCLGAAALRQGLVSCRTSNKLVPCMSGAAGLCACRCSGNTNIPCAPEVSTG